MNLNFKKLLWIGSLTGLSIFYLSMVGMVAAFNEREIIYELYEFGNVQLLTLGQILVLIPSMIGGYFIAKQVSAEQGKGAAVLSGLIIGVLSAIPMVLLIFVGTVFPNARDMFVSISAELMEVLTLGYSTTEQAFTGGLILAVIMTVSSVIGAGVFVLPTLLRKSIITATAWVLGVGMMSELLNQILNTFRGYEWVEKDTIKLILKSGTVKPGFAAIIFVVAFLWPLVSPYIRRPVSAKYQTSTPTAKTAVNYIGYAFLVLLLLSLPWIVGRFLSDVLVTISLYVLMGLGLNIAVGMAGLLDLGYLTNFAVGAYVTGILVSTGPQGIAAATGGQIAFFNLWWLIPIALLSAMLTGFVFALPVLRMRGDYLAIATLGFGEIIAKLALSDALKPYIGGAQGILFIPKPTFFGIELNDPERLYYVGLAACLFMLYVTTRLFNSRTGRQWGAIREDEDVAAAMGIDTTRTKVIAFTLSAAAGGLAGAIFATKVGTVFPNSFTVIVSINVLSLIIVGGMGSIPGIVVGAAALVGLPEILREFAEFRFLIYGALLVTMMLTKPEGLWPSEARKRELRGDDDIDLIEPLAETAVPGE
ncbi:MAG: branched-chain amino acid transport system permease protein [Cellvibrionaceae bacterium]|jgi:branched-chain amino acid transport system permease protein